MRSTGNSPGYLLLAAASTFVSAFLLFQVQPVISKIILPWYGGSPGVWTTCMLFFQAMLVAGYFYAHLLVRQRSGTVQALVHLPLLGLALALLPILPASDWKPAGGGDPTWGILTLLAVHVGLPYFLLASTAPLIQAWFFRAMPGRTPYRLYALSNFGSLLALLSYPFVVERVWASSTQATGWSFGFAGYAVLSGALLIWSWRRINATRGAAGEAAAKPAGDFQQAASAAGEAASWRHWVAWLLLPALASVALLAVTNQLCQDVAVVPLLWVAPLSLYLVSFIICFEQDAWYRPFWWGLFAVVALLALANVQQASDLQALAESVGINWEISDFLRDIRVEATVYLLALFSICMVCHGELARLKPQPSQLTSFYLMIAVGGALGGQLVALVAPRVFNAFHELPLAVDAGYLLAAYVAIREGQERFFQHRPLLSLSAFLLATAGLTIVLMAHLESLDTDGWVAKQRTFYGVVTVREHYADTSDELVFAKHGHALYNGRILHGYQYLDEAKELVPTTYYQVESGVGVAFRRLREYVPNGQLRVGAVGLGAGTVAAYGDVGDQFRFYEINPTVYRFASHVFSFLKASPADCEVVIGDARISLERELAEGSHQFHLLILDAFSGDAIPTHLITREALELYLQHLHPDGVIAYHVSNRYLNLNPVVYGLAEERELSAGSIYFHNTEEGLDVASSDWILVTRNRDFIEDPVVAALLDSEEGEPRLVWTDQFSNLVEILTD